MTTLASSEGRSRSLLRHEWEVFKSQVAELRDLVINFIYALTFQRAEWRGRTLTLLFLLITGALLLRAHQLPEWADRFRNIFIYLFNPAAAENFQTNPITDMLTFAWQGWPILLRYLPIFVLPFVIALHNAACYLADIFEKPTDLAKHFIWEVALGGSSETAVIREGEFLNKDDSLIYTIGGPGYVLVEMDSAALFEKPDGSPHVIGPTVRGPARLTGFERFRAAIDLREQHIRLDDGQDIAERSRDGLIVSAADVQIRYSIDRGNRSKNLREPFPFRSEQVVEKLIYEEPRPVHKRSTDTTRIGRYQARSNALAIANVLHGEFKRFISERKLTEFLASYSQPEIERVKQLKDAVERQKQNLLAENGQAEKLGREEKSPQFTARPEVTDIFKEKFKNLYQDMGLELIWIDIGTWKTPAAIVPESHFEAWKISSEVAREGSPKAIEAEERKSFLTRTLKLIQKLPIERYKEIKGARVKPRHRLAVGAIVSGYREQLIEAREFLTKELQKSPVMASVRRDLASLDAAIDHIDEVLRDGQFHWPHF